jgi:hypothetical protein
MVAVEKSINEMLAQLNDILYLVRVNAGIRRASIC